MQLQNIFSRSFLVNNSVKQSKGFFHHIIKTQSLAQKIQVNNGTNNFRTKNQEGQIQNEPKRIRLPYRRNQFFNTKIIFSFFSFLFFFFYFIFSFFFLSFMDIEGYSGVLTDIQPLLFAACEHAALQNWIRDTAMVCANAHCFANKGTTALSARVVQTLGCNL